MTKRKHWSSYAFKLVALLLTLAWAGHSPGLAAQSLEERFQELSRQMAQQNAVIQELRSEISQYREEARTLREQMRREQPTGAAAAAELPVEDRVALLEESQQLLDDRLEEHYQTKVESSSRYRVKLSGIVLLNAFSNHGRVDSQEVPDLALRRGTTDTRGSFGFSALQSQVGLETYGPVLAGAKSSAGLQFDFFGVSNNAAYANSWGAVRLRTATMRLDWPRTSLIAGQDAPFLSPLSPSSVVSLGYPALSYSGNLWNWIPQVRLEHRINVSEQSTFTLQGGFLDPVPRGPSQPAYAARFAWSHGDPERPLALGMGTFYSREDRGAGRTGEGWAATADWRVPLGSRVELSGEFYRGRGIGGLGAAQGRNVVFSGPESDPSSSMIGLNSIGGWAQLAVKVSPTIELNAAHGEDRPFRGDLQHFSTTPGFVIAKNRTQMFNVIYRPRTNLLFSLEYRRFRTWRLDAHENAGHLNLGVGVLF